MSDDTIAAASPIATFPDKARDSRPSTIHEDKPMIHGSRHSNIIVCASLRARSKVRYRWLLALLLPGLILMASPAALAAVAYRNAAGIRVCEGFEQLEHNDSVAVELGKIKLANRTKAQKDYLICHITRAKKDSDWAPLPGSN
jgi:hypothetical protein